MNFKWLGSAFFCSAMAFGCGGGNGGDIGSAGEAIDASIAQSCAQAFECRDSFPSDQGVTFEQVFGNSEGECQGILADLLDADALEASVAAGRVTFDGADAAACLDGLDGMTCDQLWGIDDTFQDPPECDTAFLGTVADGGACTIGQDCSGADSSCDDTSMTCGPG